MIELKECCKVPYPEKLFEEFEVRENAILANVSASKVVDMMKAFIRIHEEPLFFILELPCKEDDGGITESKTLFNTGNDCDVYFIDGLDAEQACQCLDNLGSFLVKDGMNTFGIGGHDSGEEILFAAYNVMTIYTRDAHKYKAFLEGFGIRETDTLVTAWETFEQDHPGECKCYISEINGKRIYDIPEAYKDYGMYLYETRKKWNDEAAGEITYADLPGKVLLVGITYYTRDNELLEQKQFHGIVTEANESVIRIQQANGTVFTLPPDLCSTKRARPGKYKLRSTGEIVVNPDFLATWNVFRGDPDSR